MAKRVFSGLVTAWRLAAWPTSRSPESVKATIEGVVRAPSAVLDHLGVLAFHDGDAGVGGAEIDTDDFTHVSFFPGGCSPEARMAAPGAIPINHWTRRHI